MEKDTTTTQSKVEFDGTTWKFDGHTWYTLSQICELTGRGPETIRLWTKGDKPRAIKDTSRGVRLYRLPPGTKIITFGQEE
jgi:hypothetical protein